MITNQKKSILIIGGGLIGLSIAYEFARNNFEVEVLSRNRSESAGFVAAGMLAPHAEGLENEMLDFGQRSQALIPDWIRSIERDSEIKCGLRQCGILVPFKDEMDLQKFPTLKYGQVLSELQLKNKIPGIHPMWKNALFFSQDGQIDNRRRLMRALERACTSHGVKFQEGANIKKVIFKDEIFQGIQFITATGDETTITCDQAVLCCGAWSKTIIKELPIFPVKGQMFSIQGPTNKLNTILFGNNTYLVPRDDGLVIVGATVEKNAGFKQGNTPSGIKQLNNGLKLLFPEGAAWPHMEHWWGFRPTTPDLKPIIGKSPYERLYIATGHYRNGVLLSAITSNLIFKLVQKKELNLTDKIFLEKFNLQRFCLKR